MDTALKPLEQAGRPDPAPPEPPNEFPKEGFWARLRTKWHSISIKWRIFGVFAVFTGIVLVVLWLFQTVFLDQFYEHTKKSELVSATQTVQKHINDVNLSSILDQTAQNGQIYVAVLYQDGRTLSSDYSPNRGSLIFQNILQKAYVLTEEHGGIYTERIPDQPPRGRDESRAMIYATLQKDKTDAEYMVFSYTILTPLGATVSTIRTQIVWITVILLGVALCLALYLSKHISSPIIRINDSAKQLATGDYNVAFDEDGYLEIAQLGHTLNYAAQELGQVEQLQRDLVANISHDLRTPLTMISGYAEIMRDLPGENTPENVQVIIDEAQRLTSLVNDTLDLSKLQSGTQKVEKTSFNLTADIREILHRYDKMTDYTLSFEADRDVMVYADELKISQVVYNLINNALTYTGADHCVFVRQILANEEVRIEVTDTGDGIPEDKLKDIWKRYYKVDKEHKRAQIGTGLGLSIVKTILDMHDGAYGVRSALGQGSTFWFSLKIHGEGPAVCLPATEEGEDVT